ncbi:hypothetical protein TIFTF001_042921 [Ficus carica]|uniref:Uncharacterized protein n=1 Tax=Ficus carica TaxID=3494 RepID=A0AA87YP93_FICCA|nr:hypothetical protein TIFTF001_042921 [Ficus carica]
MGSKHGAEPSFRKPSWKHGDSTTVFKDRRGLPRLGSYHDGLLTVVVSPTRGGVPRRSSKNRRGIRIEKI